MKPHHHKIIELHKAGTPVADIAKAVFRGERAVEHVISKAIRTGMLKPRWGTTRGGRKDEIINRMLAGQRQAQIARDMDITPSAVAGVLYRYRSRLTTHPETTNDVPMGITDGAMQVSCAAG